MLKMM